MHLENGKLIVLLIGLGMGICSISIFNVVQATTQGNLVGDITELTTTIMTVAIPAVAGLIIAITGMVAAISGRKEAKEAHEVSKAGGLFAITFGQKINDVVHKLNPFMTEAFEQLPDETKTKLNTAGVTVRDWNAIAVASAAQMNQLREKIPDDILAQMDPNVLPLTREQDVLDGLAGNANATTSSSRTTVGKK